MPNSSRMIWPYPAENQQPWFDAFADFIAALDASGYASREDRSIIFTQGGLITWVAGTSTLSWSAPLRLLSAISGFTWDVASSTLTIDDGQLVYVELTRAPSSNLTVTPVVASQVPSSDTALILCVRMGSKIYWRNGLALSDGDSVSDIGSGSGAAGSPGYYVFQPGGVAEGNVYITWTSLYTAVQTSPGEKIVVVDDSLGLAKVDAGVWDINGWVLKGRRGFIPLLTVPEGATFVAALGTQWKIESLQLVSSRTTDYVSSFDGVFGVIIVGQFASITGSATRPFFRIRGFGNPQLLLHVENGASLGQFVGNVCETADAGRLSVYLYDGSAPIGALSFTQAAPGQGELHYRIYGNSPSLLTTQLGYFDAPTYVRLNDLRYMAFVYKELLLNDAQAGVVELLVGSVYLTAGTVVSGLSAAMIGGAIPADTANLRLRQYTGAVATGGVFTTVGTLAAATPAGGDFTITASDWYDVYLYAGGGGQTALAKGLRLVIEPSIDNGV